MFGSPITATALGHFASIRTLGYSLIEIAYEPQAPIGARELRAAAHAVGLRLSVAGNFTGGRDLSADDESVRAEGLRYLIDCIDFTVQVGADVVAGPMYSAVGKARLLEPAKREQQRWWAVQNIRRAADHAARHGVRLAIEPLNRFETDLVNTTAQALALCDDIERENVGLSLDTFHMNIEEDSFSHAIIAAAPRLFSFQASENTRGTPGSGHVPWAEVFATLRKVRYDGPVIVEAFKADDAGLASTLSLWRPVTQSMDGLMRDAAAFIAPQWKVDTADRSGPARMTVLKNQPNE